MRRGIYGGWQNPQLTMREHKFRVWSSIDKNFIPFDIYEYPSGLAGGVSEPMEFTGLKDKNGREIYEGDVLTYREKMHEHGDICSHKGQVVYDSERAAFGIAGLKTAEIWNYFTDGGLSDFEAVGNIFN
jgi:hypothetical protein